MLSIQNTFRGPITFGGYEMSLINEYSTQEERIKEDFKWLKNELMGLTIEERCIILEEYIEQVRNDSRIGVKEYQNFLEFLNSIEKE